MNYYLGIDIGSTAVKAVLVSAGAGNRIAGRGSAAYPTRRDGLSVEQNPDDWNRAAAEAAKEACSGLDDAEKKKIAGISLSAQAGSVYAADREYRPLTPAYTWMDRTAPGESDMIGSAFGDRVKEMCGWGNSPAAVSAKILMLRRTRPELFAKTAYWLTTEESVTGFLTGNYVTDPTGQAITRLYDVKKLSYDGQMLDFLGITEKSLPRVLPCGSFAGRLTAGAAELIGIPEGVPVFVGAHDQYCASIGSGVTEPGQMLCATGTAWVIFGVSDRFFDRPPYPPCCAHPASGKYGFMISMSGCGGALDAFAASRGLTLRQIDGMIEAEDPAALREKTRDLFATTLPPGQSIPHREGAVPPPADAGCSPEYAALAAMESCAFETRILCDALAEAGAATGTVVMSGGASKSRLWRGILAAVMSPRKLFRLCEPDAPALGAALIAAVSAGEKSSLAEASADFVRTEPVIVMGDPDAAAYYEEKYQAYRSVALA